jgi:hypothetical protein
MYHIHKYMGYTNAQEQYTNEQFYLSAKSLGFAEKDARKIWGMLFHLFSQRCEPPKPIPHWAEPAPQSICTNVSEKLGRMGGYLRLTKRYRRIALCRSMRRVSCMIRCIRRCPSRRGGAMRGLSRAFLATYMDECQWWKYVDRGRYDIES